MIALVTKLDPQWYSPRTYIVAETDALGFKKAEQAEAALLGNRGGEVSTTTTTTTKPQRQQPTVLTLPRAREVGQSYLTSIGTTLRALWAAASLVWREKPELVLVNGPGTCLPVVVAAKVFSSASAVLRCLLLRRTPKTTWGRVCYVESIARTSSLSLTGKILYSLRLADLFLVQWPSLAERFPRTTCAGRLY